jgi:DDE superfamily endonuclease
MKNGATNIQTTSAKRYLEMRPSPEWQVLLEPFRSLFTKPGYRYFCAFVLVFAHLDRRLWVTQVILAGLVDRHFTSFYRFLREGAWSVAAVRQQVWELCRERCLDDAGRVSVVADDTVAAKYGRHFDALGWHHDPMNRQHPKHLSHGHCFVCLAGLAEQTKDHFVSLFLGCALYVQAKACRHGRVFATKLELAARLVLELTLPPGQVLVVVVDGGYARQPFVQAVWASGRQVVSRLRRDTVFYDAPPPREPGKRGAPRKYGRKQKAREWAAGEEAAWEETTLRLYGRDRRLRYKTRVVLQRTLGVKIRLVAVQLGERPVVFLFSTDTALSAVGILHLYCGRFPIETGFRDSKQHFGLTTYQVRSERSIERIVHLCLWAQTLLRLVCWEMKAQAQYGAWRQPLEYLTLSQQKEQSRAACGIRHGSPASAPKAENAETLREAA